MSKRKAISPGVKFAVLSRDKFRCRYCGKDYRRTILEIDHIVPVAKGGSNEIDNLITACLECNRGKGAMLLENEDEVVKQTKLVGQWKMSTLAENEAAAVRMAKKWCSLFPGKHDCTLDEVNILSEYVARFDPDIVLNSMYTAFRRYITSKEFINPSEWQTAFDKMVGIAYNLQKKRNTEHVEKIH